MKQTLRCLAMACACLVARPGQAQDLVAVFKELKTFIMEDVTIVGAGRIGSNEYITVEGKVGNKTGKQTLIVPHAFNVASYNKGNGTYSRSQGSSEVLPYKTMKEWLNAYGGDGLVGKKLQQVRGEIFSLPDRGDKDAQGDCYLTELVLAGEKKYDEKLHWSIGNINKIALNENGTLSLAGQLGSFRAEATVVHPAALGENLELTIYGYKGETHLFPKTFKEMAAGIKERTGLALDKVNIAAVEGFFQEKDGVQILAPSFIFVRLDGEEKGK